MTHFPLEIKIHYHSWLRAAEHNILVYESFSSGVDSNIEVVIQSGGCKSNVHIFWGAEFQIFRFFDLFLGPPASFSDFSARSELRVCKPLRSFLLLAALKRVSLAMMSSLAT